MEVDTMENKWIVGVDIGGTTSKMAFITPKGDIVSKWQIPTDHRNHGGNIPEQLKYEIEKKCSELGAENTCLMGIGVGAPGSVNAVTGIVREATNLSWKSAYPLKKNLEATTGLPVAIDNDANCAALGEMWKGSGQGARNLVLVTLGTGIGSGIVINGHIVHGAGGAAGEIGHLASNTKDGYLCKCGKHGCLETIASATGIVRAALAIANDHSDGGLSFFYKQNGTITAKNVFDFAERGDHQAKSVVDYALEHLGIALANVANTLNPEKIVIGGGVSKAGQYLLTRLNHYYQQHLFPTVKETTEIKLASLGNDAGVLGAAWIADQLT